MGLFDIFSKKTDEYYLKEGNNFFSEKHYAEAVASYDKAIAINPNYTSAWYNRGRAFVGLKRFTEVIDSYKKVFATEPNFAEMWFVADDWYNIGHALYELERYSEAIDSYDKATAIEKGYTLAWIERGISLNFLGKYSDSLASLNKAIAISADNAYPTVWNIGKNGMYKERPIGSNEKDVYVWNFHGNALNQLGRHAEAVASFNKALAINPNNAHAKEGLEIALKKRT